MQFLKRIFRFFLQTIKVITTISGITFLLMIVLSFTSLPYWAVHHLGTANSAIQGTPDYIVVMGAGAMPGARGLIRCNYAARAARLYPEARVLIAMPAIPGSFIGSEPFKMYEEIVRYGISKDRFLFETRGTDTHSQACNVFEILKPKSGRKLLIVTSPEHMYRSILTFEKCGFDHVDGLSSFQTALSNDLLLTEKERETGRTPLARNITVRYNMWNYLKLEIDIMRELAALAWYKINGYI